MDAPFAGRRKKAVVDVGLNAGDIGIGGFDGGGRAGRLRFGHFDGGVGLLQTGLRRRQLRLRCEKGGLGIFILLF